MKNLNFQESESYFQQQQQQQRNSEKICVTQLVNVMKTQIKYNRKNHNKSHVTSKYLITMKK
jgi:hypothetical protein